MRLLKLVTIVILIFGLVLTGFCKETKRVAKIVGLNGVVEVKTGRSTWRPAKIGMTLKQNDILRTSTNSWTRLNLNGKAETATIEVKENSQLLFRELIVDSAKHTQKTLLDLGLGKILIKAKKLHSKESRFEIKTPTSIVGVRGTTFSVEVEALE